MMQMRRVIPLVMMGCMVVFLSLGPSFPLYGQTNADNGPLLQVRIRDVDGLLQRWASLAPAGSGTQAPSQTAMIRGLLQGTDWIDPARAIVADMDYDGETASWRVLIPFREPNENFQRSYGALAGDDYYVLRFPPEPEPSLPAPERERLLQAATAPAETDVVMELAARHLLERYGDQLETAIQSLASNAEGADTAATFAPEALQRMARDMIEVFRQVETLQLGLNTDPETLLLLMNIEAVKQSYLSGVLVDPKTDVRLGSYRPDYPLQFRSRPYNVAGAVQILEAGFGQFYRRMGFDFDELAEIAKGLTGEMAGGMALDQDGMRFEMIYVLHPTEDAATYLTEVYLPWFEKYNQRMASMMSAQTGQPVTPLYERTPDSTVAGARVIGVRTRFPAMTPGGPQVSAGPDWQDNQTRLTAVDGLILMASSDAVIEAMLASRDTFRAAPAQGVLAEFSMDVGNYLTGLQGLTTRSGPKAAIPEDIGDLTLTADVAAGRLTTRARMKVQDIRQTMALFAALSAGMAERPALAADASAAAAHPTPASKRPAPPEDADTPAYWMDRGGLLSAYGNYPGAVRSYRKALELDPDLAEAFFQMGVAYGEMGRLDAAIQAISRAIDRMPSNGAYFYGRARVYLRAGEEELAMQDFMEAGFLGHEDARAYLKDAGVDWH